MEGARNLKGERVSDSFIFETSGLGVRLGGLAIGVPGGVDEEQMKRPLTGIT